MRWRETAPELLAMVFWLFGPGLGLFRAAGVRGMIPFLVAPAVSVGTLAAWAILLPFVGLPWNGPVALGAVLLTMAAVFAARKVTQRLAAQSVKSSTQADASEPTIPRARGVGSRLDRLISTASPWLGAVVGGILGAVPAFRGMTRPDLIPIAPDTLFHVNSVRAILESGDASSFNLLSTLAQAPAPGTYPAAWAGIVALATNSSVVAAANILALCIVGIIWPLGLAALARAIAPDRPGLALVTPIVGAGFIAFPTRLLSWGTLWPNALSFALVPAAVACTAMALRRAGAGETGFVRVGWILATIIGWVGLLFAQPNGLLTYAIIASPLVIARAISAAARARRAPAKPTGLSRGAAITAPLLGAAAWCGIWAVFWVWSARSARGAHADWFHGFWDGIWAAVTDRPPLADEYFGMPAHTTLLLALLAAGLVTALAIAGTRWIVVAYALLLVVAGIASTQMSLTWLGDAWWGDLFRLRAAAAIGSTLLAGLGVYGVCTVLTKGVVRVIARQRSEVPASTDRRQHARWTFRIGAALQVIALAGLAMATGAMGSATREEVMFIRYQAGAPWPADVTEPELGLLKRLGTEIPSDGLLIGAPATGAAFAFAVSDVDVVFRTYTGPWNEDATFLFHNFQAIHSDPEVCAALDRLGATHFYTDLNRVPGGNDPGVGLAIRAPQPGFRLVDREGTARVYEITACD